jgi:fumarate hydratase class II
MDDDLAHPRLRDLPIGVEDAGKRHETDSIGSVDVPADRYWGAQTERSLLQYSIGDDRMPKRVYHAYGYVKKAVALVNAADARFELWSVALPAELLLLALGLTAASAPGTSV